MNLISLSKYVGAKAYEKLWYKILWILLTNFISENDNDSFYEKWKTLFSMQHKKEICISFLIAFHHITE